jgi:hypothetical protein
MPNKTLSAIIVNYRSEIHLEECIASIRKKISNISEIIIVNNDEADINPRLSDLRGIKIIKKENHGFGAAANAGFRKSSGDIVLFLNPDARILSENFQAIIDEFVSDSRLAVIGPSLISGGENQPWSAGEEIGIFGLVRNNLRISKSRKIWGKKEKTPVDWVSGTAMFVRREVLEKVGGFDENFFMYFEDMDLCRRVRMAGFGVAYFPAFKVSHLGGESYSDSRRQKKDYYDSMEYFFKKHRSKFQWRLVRFIRKIFY